MQGKMENSKWGMTLSERLILALISLGAAGVIQLAIIILELRK